MAHSGGKKAIIAAMAANAAIAAAKFVAFLVTTSSAMLAESVHSLADTGNQILLLVGGKKALKAPDADHPFGFGRERYFWSFVVSIILFTAGALFAIYEAIHKIQHPEPLESAAWAIGVLVFALAMEANSFRAAVKESRPLKGSSSWVQFIKRSKHPELPVVLLEDLAALIGLLLALVAIGLNIVTGNAVWDGIGTLCIGLLLGVVAITLAIEMKSLLIGEAADPVEEKKISDAILATSNVRDLIFLRTQHFGPDELLVTAKVEFSGSLSMVELAQAIDEVEANIRAAQATAHFIFIEPDIRRAVATNIAERDRLPEDDPPHPTPARGAQADDTPEQLDDGATDVDVGDPSAT